RTAVVRRSMTTGQESTIYSGDVRSMARSLDGRRLAMVIVDPEGKRTRLVTMAADGSNVSADLMSTATTQNFPQDIHRPLLAEVAWIPGGDRLLVVQIEPGGGLGHTIWEVPVSGAAPRKLNSLRLTPVKGRNWLGAAGLTIHPGGKLLAFQ